MKEDIKLSQPSRKENIGAKTFTETTFAFRSKHIAFERRKTTTTATNQPKIATLFLWSLFVWVFKRVVDWISQM